MRCSQNVPLPPRIYPPPFQQLYMTLPESTLPFQNIPTFQQQYATLPESTPPSQNIPPFNKCILCATLQEYTSFSLNIPPPLFNNYMRPSQNIPFPLRIYPPFSTNVYVQPSQNIPLPPSLPEYTPLFNNQCFWL